MYRPHTCDNVLNGHRIGYLTEYKAVKEALPCGLSFQFGASVLTHASWTRTSLARPTSTRCQFGANSSLTRGSSARFASLARCSFSRFLYMLTHSALHKDTNNVEM